MECYIKTTVRVLTPTSEGPILEKTTLGGIRFDIMQIDRKSSCIISQLPMILVPFGKSKEIISPRSQIPYKSTLKAAGIGARKLYLLLDRKLGIHLDSFYLYNTGFLLTVYSQNLFREIEDYGKKAFYMSYPFSPPSSNILDLASTVA